MSCCEKSYYCPTSKDYECAEHGGFSTCCDKPEMHCERPLAGKFIQLCRDHKHLRPVGVDIKNEYPISEECRKFCDVDRCSKWASYEFWIGVVLG